MHDEPSTEWWMWKLYRQVAEYLRNPDSAAEAQLFALARAYRKYHRYQSDRRDCAPPHGCGSELR